MSFDKKSYMKKWREENKDYCKNYREKNKEVIKEKRKNYYENNKEVIRESNKKYNRTLEGKYIQLKKSAKKRGLEVQISFEQYAEIIKESKCYYCDASIEDVAGSSLNRVDNTKGYLIANVRPCCYICNVIMSDFTKKQLENRFYKILERIN